MCEETNKQQNSRDIDIDRRSQIRNRWWEILLVFRFTDVYVPPNFKICSGQMTIHRKRNAPAHKPASCLMTNNQWCGVGSTFGLKAYDIGSGRQVLHIELRTEVSCEPAFNTLLVQKTAVYAANFKC